MTVSPSDSIGICHRYVSIIVTFDDMSTGHLSCLIDYRRGTSVHAQKGRGLHEDVLKMLHCGTVCRFWSIFHTKSDTF